MTDAKRRWSLNHINAWGESVPLITFTARGFEKAVKKLMRRLERRRGVAALMDYHPDHFRLEIEND